MSRQSLVTGRNTFGENVTISAESSLESRISAALSITWSSGADNIHCTMLQMGRPDECLFLVGPMIARNVQIIIGGCVECWICSHAEGCALFVPHSIWHMKLNMAATRWRTS